MLTLTFLDSFEQQGSVGLLTKEGIFVLQKPPNKNDFVENFYFLYGKRYPIEESYLSINSLEEKIKQENSSVINKFIFNNTDINITKLIPEESSSENYDEEKFMQDILFEYKALVEMLDKKELQSIKPKRVPVPKFNPVNNQFSLEDVIKDIFNQPYFIAGNLFFKLREGFDEEEYIHFNGKNYVAYEIYQLDEFKKRFEEQFFKLTKDNIIKNLKEQYSEEVKKGEKEMRKQDIAKHLTLVNKEQIKFNRVDNETYQVILTLPSFSIKWKENYYVFEKRCELYIPLTVEFSKIKLKNAVVLTEDYKQDYKHPFIFESGGICIEKEVYHNNLRTKGIDPYFNDSYSIKGSDTASKVAFLLHLAKNNLYFGVKYSTDGGIPRKKLEPENYLDRCFKTKGEVLKRGIKEEDIYDNDKKL